LVENQSPSELFLAAVFSNTEELSEKKNIADEMVSDAAEMYSLALLA